MLKLAPALAVILAAPLPAMAAVDPAPVVAAERAFAADGLAMGIKGSFLKHSAEDAIILRPDPMNAHAVYGARKDDAGGPPLAWWPVWAGIARSDDLGFTTGPATYEGKPSGFYFTIWKKQPDGAWKWVFDSGVEADSTGAPGPQTAPVYLPVSPKGAGSAAAALAQVTTAEAALAKGAAKDVSAAYLNVLAEDARIQGSPAAPAQDPEAVQRELKTRPVQMQLSPLGGLASSAGDLVWTYGDARWTAGGKPARGHYVRVWQKRKAGWRLVFDEMIDVPPGA